MKQRRHANFYIPQHTSPFKFEELILKSLPNQWKYSEDNDTHADNKIPYGIIDFTKHSSEYLAFVSALNIEEHSNSEIYEILIYLVNDGSLQNLK